MTVRGEHSRRRFGEGLACVRAKSRFCQCSSPTTQPMQFSLTIFLTVALFFFLSTPLDSSTISICYFRPIFAQFSACLHALASKRAEADSQSNFEAWPCVSTPSAVRDFLWPCFASDLPSLAYTRWPPQLFCLTGPYRNRHRVLEPILCHSVGALHGRAKWRTSQPRAVRPVLCRLRGVAGAVEIYRPPYPMLTSLPLALPSQNAANAQFPPELDFEDKRSVGVEAVATKISVRMAQLARPGVALSAHTRPAALVQSLAAAACSLCLSLLIPQQSLLKLSKCHSCMLEPHS
jgi:hypothetical protein